MIMQGKRLHAQTSFYGQSADFYLTDYDRQGNRLIAGKVEFEPFPEGSIAVAPSFTLSLDLAQEFFEEMWAQGFRSKHDRGNADKLDAARVEHLADLRKAAKLT